LVLAVGGVVRSAAVLLHEINESLTLTRILIEHAGAQLIDGS
jgi:hypothetical protein